jgi:hypothetical protein
MTIRKFIGIILSSALVIDGVWISYTVMAVDRVDAGQLVYVGPYLFFVGAVWIYSGLVRVTGWLSHASRIWPREKCV